MVKILKYNRINLGNSLIGRNPFYIRSNWNNIYEKSRSNDEFFFKPHIDIIANLNKKTTSIKLCDNNELEICIWTIPIHNKDDRKRKLRFAKNASDCNCSIDIMKAKKSFESSELYIIENLPNFDFNNNEIDTEKLITKYCNELNTYLNNITNITRNSSKELLFLITLRNSNFMYLFEKQNVPSFEEYNGIIENKNFLIPRKLEVNNYEINIVFNCKEKKDERGRTYLLTVSSWNDVKLSHVP
jgi:hypothetical protein